jgi:hypothetical protein
MRYKNRSKVKLSREYGHREAYIVSDAIPEFEDLRKHTRIKFWWYRVWFPGTLEEIKVKETSIIRLLSEPEPPMVINMALLQEIWGDEDGQT